MSIPASTSALQSSIRELCIGGKGPIRDIARPSIPTSVPKKKKAPVVADSWEDEMIDSSASDSEPPQSHQDNSSDMLSMSALVGAEGPLDPPPTPISPQTSHTWAANTPAYTSTGPVPSSQDSSNFRSSASARRPEKQTAVANRMIAGALGLRAPKRTEEQRAYDRAVKEQEIRRRNKEKEEAARAKEEEEKAKAAVWDD
ncbi:hypothetical protein ARAM_006876 [Aspergillus rambellii]|uniref:Uncharacterized protein n=2 Tax=Aspergillus subgen. Nidulantes TaxID=2720870 RepID=A0A0F8WW96_9EURO|nr:hypothetical protein ARAM_006876 [Aspergillus rambellii]KKK16553.1 hypothetical protein AOCH_004574 [Aspergillus ochraceoroseus]